MAVKQGAPLPGIGSVAALRQSLLAARAGATIDPAAAAGSSGIHLWQLFEKRGLTAQLKPKAVLAGPAAAPVLKERAMQAP